jgi:WD40 repeat protein
VTAATAGATVGKNVKVWSFDGHTLKATGTVLDSDGWLGLAFSPDGTLLAVPVSGGVDLWNTSDWSYGTTLLGSSNLFAGALFTPDGNHIIAADEGAGSAPGNLYVFDLTAATPELPVTVVPLAGQPDSLAVAAKTVSGQLGVAVAYRDGTVDVFSYANAAFTGPTNLVVDSGGSQVWSPVFSPDGSLLAVGDSSSTIHFWAFPVPASLAESGSEITFSTSDSSDVIFALAFSPNGSYLAAGGGDSFQDQVDSRAGVFTVSTRSALAGATSTHDVGSIAFSPFGNAVAGGEIDCGKVFMCTN